MDYETIKELAKANDISVKDLLALSPNNDPFYVGSAGKMEKAKWFANVYKQMGSPRECHIRRVHYWVVSKALKKPDGSVYENTEEDWGFLTMCAKYARYAGFVPIENMTYSQNTMEKQSFSRFAKANNPAKAGGFQTMNKEQCNHNPIRSDLGF